MTLAEKLAAIAGAPEDADLAQLLGVEPAAIAFDRDGLHVAGETVSYADARAALNGSSGAAAARRTVKVEDL